MVPKYIIYETEDEDYVIALFCYMDQVDTEPTCLVYKYHSLYHELNQAQKALVKLQTI